MKDRFLSLLHVEDDDGDAKEVMRSCRQEFGAQNLDLTRVVSLTEAKAALKERRFDAVLLDLNLGDASGLENVRAIKIENPDVPIVVLSGQDSTDTALEAVQYGAQEYLVKGHSNSRILGLIIRSSIERKAYERQLFRMATQDELTGLPNRRYFKEYMQQCIPRATRWNRTECILFMDVNGFKSVNDTYGHDVGDLLLKQVAASLRSGLRMSDMLARYAGDEFVAHLDTGATNAKEASVSVISNIEDQFRRAFTIDGNDIKTGLSIGVAFFPDHGRDTEALIKSADKAMYKAKQAGISHAIAD
ncbi:diguanylate cyclase domain-containing protein [Sneathiella glossodoripedis]|uniref:diguanylate cyclase domain-containing protein n=1 Tax=Sneathiella glossodoripedis TaxID=418853 RepID=UPI0011DC7AE5|nr:diguanylate cyclase [Sneathiella glossodoripedis]